MKLNFISLALLIFISACICNLEALYQKYSPGVFQCFTESLLDNQNVVIKYSIPTFKDPSILQIKGAEINGLIVYVKNPNGLLIKEEIAHNEIGAISFISSAIGDYEVCVRTSKWAQWVKDSTEKNELEAKLEILVDDLMHEANPEFESKSRVEGISNMISSLTNHMMSVQKQMQYSSIEEDKMRELYESTNRRMWWASFATAIALVGCGIFQALTLKKIMIQKKFA